MKTIFYKIRIFCFLLLLLSTIAVKGQNGLHPLGAKLLPKEEYEKLPKVNLSELRVNINEKSIRAKKSGLVMLDTPPVGNQYSQASCVGWAVGYAAASIIAYPKFANNWNYARRSPNYIFNQIKSSSDCRKGSLTKDAVALVTKQGVCSYLLIPKFHLLLTKKP